MAIYLGDSDTIILLPPKIGSHWITRAIEVSKIRHAVVGPTSLRNHGTLAQHGRQFSGIITFVRHPITWYQSYWQYRSSNNSWDDGWELDHICGHTTFPEFVQRAAHNLPGYVSRMFEQYAGPRDDPVKFIGRQERLCSDLLSFLDEIGEKYRRDCVLTLQRENASSQHPKLDPYLETILRGSENDAITRYGYA